MLLIITLGFGATGLLAADSEAFQGDTGTWSDPLNLSQSGAATEPRMVVDSNDVLHVIWREDAVNSFFYTRRVAGEWQTPVPLELPFAARDLTGENADMLFNPQLLADRTGHIHAFWRDAKNVLSTSSVVSSEFENTSSWSESQQLSASVAEYAAAVDGENNIHLSFMRRVAAAETSAGIYYMKRSGVDQIWSQIIPVYESSYYRAVDPDNAMIGIATVSGGGVDLIDTTVVSDSAAIIDSPSENAANSTRVIIATDNRLIEQLFAFLGVNGGDIWLEPLVVDERRNADTASSVGPSHISVISNGDKIHLTWLAGHETNCEQYHQWSSDGALSWESPVIVPSSQQGCPDNYELLTNENGLMFLLAYWGEQAYLQAWNGTSWTEPEIQPVLTTFVDPVVNRNVSLGCQQTGVTGDGGLIVVGCGGGNVHDVWMIERSLGNEATWFPPPETTVWSEPELLFDDADVQVRTPILLSGIDDLLHSFWIGSDRTATEDGGPKIYYTQWNGDSWLHAVPLFHLDTIDADQLRGALYENGCIFLMWRDPQINTHYFQQVDESNVLFPTDWSSARQLFGQETVVDSPDIYIESTGELGVVYAKPLNEARGIYFMQVEVCGTELSEPRLIFDAVQAEWDMAGNPHMVQTPNHDYHAIVTRYELRPEPMVTSLYYFQSRDRGETWSSPDPIADGNILWSQILNPDQNTVLIIWQQVVEEQLVLFAKQSIDGGYTWDSPRTLLSSSALTAQPAILVDKYRRAQFLQLAFSNDELALQERSWQGGNWTGVEEYSLTFDFAEGFLVDVAAAAQLDGKLAMAYIVDSKLESSEASFSRQLLTTRDTDIPELTSFVPSETPPTLELTPTQLPPLIQEPEITPSTNDSIEDAGIVGVELSQSSTSIVVVLVPAVLLVVFVVIIVIGVRTVRAKQ